MRLDKYISDAAQISRTDARKAIQKGLMCINGEVCRKADSNADNCEITYNGKTVSAQKFVYIMLDKPKGVVSAAVDKNDVTVVDIVKKDYPRRNLFPAGRLDKQSTGFVLITDDGNFAHDILAPKRHVSKTYEVTIDTPVTDDMIKGFENGVTLADGETMKPAELLRGDTPCECIVVLKQGVYHQIKRMFGVYDAGVNELRRVAIGGLKLDESLGLGNFREIKSEEIRLIDTNSTQF